jgi:predicted ribosome quality control (RQC) complex YloA/Tae2 family protein
MSEAVGSVYDASESDEAEATLRRELRAAVRAALERADRQRRRVEADLTGEARAEGWRIDGELLASNLHKVQRGDTGVEVVDYYDPDQRTRVIPLDAELSPQENVERLFRKHRKAIDAAAAALEQSEEVEGRYSALAALRDRVEHAALEELPALRAEIAAGGLLREAAAGSSPSRRREVAEFPPGVRIRRTNVDGWEILYGENATSNDYLTTRVARPDDLWLHVRAAASAHVVIRTGGRADRVPPRVLEQAARAAAAHSESKHAGLVPVDYVLRKHVRKPRRSAPGLVTYQNEKTLFISPETR